MTDKTFWRKALIKGVPAMVPSDSRTDQIFQTYRQGETRGGKLTCPRNIGFHRLAHAIGGLIADNVDDFQGMTAHKALKRLQLESGIECDEGMLIRIGGQQMIYKEARSLSFDSMGQDRFRALIAGLCEYVISAYWPDTTVDDIQKMADEFQRSRS